MKLNYNHQRRGLMPKDARAEWHTAELGKFDIHVENTDGGWRFKVHPFGHESLPNYATKETAYAAGLLWLRRKLTEALMNVDGELSELAKEVTNENS